MIPGMTTTQIRISWITCRLCGNRCHGPIDTGQWAGHKATCPAKAN